MRLNYYTEEEENYTIRIMLIPKNPVETQTGKCDVNYIMQKSGDWRTGTVEKDLHSKYTTSG